ncbi:hypothetical protein [Leptospira ilyithenensis]|uniref:DUF5808 domain-containing protein n=1 Tax=Leptospira ilyithenensis TaxID=2484901 RepID=A0A4R9LRD7_9LEPT|nr:hypothetical protein [Leptospira ilyithenensis]TGN10550.1 hypothetical protein EHS11_09700 [Leptospira ilyithenensis]
MKSQDEKNFWGIPYGTEISTEALVKDLWDPTTDEILTPKTFLGLGWGINLHAVGKKIGLVR